MNSKVTVMESLRHEPALEEEMAAFGDGDVVDFMNLSEDETGVEGTLFLSTAMGGHGPRVKYYLKTGPGQPSFSVSVSTSPEVLATSLPQRIANKMAPSVIAWVKLNRTALLKFWSEGQYWSRAEVNAFAEALKKLPHE